jgi:hypothetical protein
MWSSEYNKKKSFLVLDNKYASVPIDTFDHRSVNSGLFHNPPQLSLNEI